MKVIQDNYIEKHNSEQYICEHCNSVFEYNKEDIRFDADDEEIVFCPCCHKICYIDYTPITADNVEFPKSFYQFGVHNGAVKIDDEEITFWIKDCINWLKNNPNESFKYRGSGDTFICVFNHDDEYYIIVAKNYFDTSIDK